ncbi:MAG: MFS transporter [Actinomycetes bacterium]
MPSADQEIHAFTSGPRQRLALYATVGSLGRAATSGLPSALVLAMISIGGSAADGAVMVAALTAVAGLVGPLSGAAIDRLEFPRRGYLAGVIVLIIGSAALVIGIGQWPLPVLIAVAALTGLAQPVFTGAWSAQVRRVVPDMPLARVYAIDVGSYNVAEIAGPALVGVAFIVDASVPGAASVEVVLGLYLVTALLLPLVPIPPRSATHTGPVIPFGRTLAQMRVMWSSLSLRRNTFIGTISFGAFGFIVIGSPLLGEDLAGDAGFGALLLAMIAGGALVGTIWLARAPIVRVGPGTIAIFTTLLLAVVLLGIAAAPTMTVAFVLALVFGFVQAPQLTGVFQVRDRESPQQARSLVFATAASLRTGAFAIGSLTAGALVDSGWRPIFVAAALTQILSVALGLLFAARQHRRPNSR